MPEIIPAIIAKNFDELKSKVELVEAFVKTVQLDVMDGVFVDNKTWNTPEDLDKLETNLEFEAHLMIESPHRILNRWLASSKISRVILHWEALEKNYNHEPSSVGKQADVKFPILNLTQEAHLFGKQFGVALNPGTPIGVLDDFVNDIDLVLLMSVNPGFARQEFKEAVIPKIIALRQRYENVRIEVDGGVDPQNILKLVAAGADFLVIGSAIFANSDPRAVIKDVYKMINKK